MNEKDKIFQQVSGILSKIVNINLFKLEDELTDIGINSKNFVKLCIEIEDEFEIRMTLSEMDFGNHIFLTINSIVEYIYSKMQEKSCL